MIDCKYPLPIDFLKLLASTLMVDKNTGEVLGFNYVIVERECNAANECVPAINCDLSHREPHEIVMSGFKIDACGNLALVLANCTAT